MNSEGSESYYSLNEDGLQDFAKQRYYPEHSSNQSTDDKAAYYREPKAKSFSLDHDIARESAKNQSHSSQQQKGHAHDQKHYTEFDQPLLQRATLPIRLSSQRVFRDAGKTENCLNLIITS